MWLFINARRLGKVECCTITGCFQGLETDLPCERRNFNSYTLFIQSDTSTLFFKNKKEMASLCLHCHVVVYYPHEFGGKFSYQIDSKIPQV